MIKTVILFEIMGVFPLGMFAAVWIRLWLFRHQKHGLMHCVINLVPLCAAEWNDTCVYCMCVAWSWFSAACKRTFLRRRWLWAFYLPLRLHTLCRITCSHSLTSKVNHHYSDALHTTLHVFWWTNNVIII